MPLIPTRIHALLDYVVSAFVIALPFLFGLDGTPRMLFVALGLFGIAYSLLTAYELGVVKLIPMRLHLLLDIVFIGALLVLAALTPNTGLQIVCVVAALAAGLLVAFTRRAPALRQA